MDYLDLLVDAALDERKPASSFSSSSSSSSSSSHKPAQPTQKRKLSKKNTSGYRGVSKSGNNRYVARLRVNHKLLSLGTYDTPKEAALAFDRAIVLHKLPNNKLNYPDGLPKDDPHYAELMNPPKRRRLLCTNTSGFNGVTRRGQRFQAQIRIKKKLQSLGTFSSSTEAALAFDKAIRHYNLKLSKLNYPKGLPKDDPEYDRLMDPDYAKKSRIGSRTSTTGFRGVTLNGKRYAAKIKINRKMKHLGTFNTPELAARAYDRAVINNSMSNNKLNYPDDEINAGARGDTEEESIRGEATVQVAVAAAVAVPVQVAASAPAAGCQQEENKVSVL